jgi:hypothetical protein
MPQPPKKPTVRIEEVSPAMADKWLGTQTRNRHLRESRVDFWVGVIDRGEWELTNDAISFDTDGHLLNGQHRLTALVVSEQTLPLVVLRNLPMTAIDVMDTGLTRKTSDALQLRGELNVNALAAALRWEWLMASVEADPDAESPFWAGGRNFRVSTNQLLAVFDTDPDGFREAVGWISRARKQLPIRTGVGSCLRRRLLLIDEADGEDFWDKLESGAGLKAGSSILKLRQILVSSHSSRFRSMSDFREAALIIKAWNYYREGQTIGSLMWKYGATTREAFPIPQ